MVLSVDDRGQGTRIRLRVATCDGRQRDAGQPEVLWRDDPLANLPIVGQLTDACGAAGTDLVEAVLAAYDPRSSAP